MRLMRIASPVIRIKSEINFVFNEFLMIRFIFKRRATLQRDFIRRN